MRNRAGTALGLFISGLGLACGGPLEVPDSELTINGSALEVWAEPSSTEFETSTEVVLNTSEPGSQIYFTVDGSDPSGGEALPYGEPLALDRSTLVTFIAKTPDGVWSKPRSEFYVFKQDSSGGSAPLDRDLWLESRSLFFAARVGSKDWVVRRLKLKSSGLQRLTIAGMLMTPNPSGRSFYQPGSFSYEILTDQTQFPIHLVSGETLELEITYRPTETFSSAAIVIESDSERESGRHLVELWGRVVAW